MAEAVNSGAAGGEALCQALGPAHDYRRVTIVSALGEAEGPFGVPMLESLVLDQREDSDVRCAGLVALSKRIGIEVVVLARVVSLYALLCPYAGVARQPFVPREEIDAWLTASSGHGEVWAISMRAFDRGARDS